MPHQARYTEAMPPRRSYQDACAASHALDLVGERWALLVVRELLLGPKRFTDLRAGLPGISANVLTQRLGELEESAILRRHKLPPPAAAWVYELTEWGQDLEPIVLALGRWALKSPGLHRDVPMGSDGLVLSWRVMFCPKAAEGLKLSLDLHLGADRFEVLLADGQLKVARGAAQAADAVVHTDANSLGGLIYRGQSLESAAAEGRLRLEGDRQAFAQFLTLFPGPSSPGH